MAAATAAVAATTAADRNAPAPAPASGSRATVQVPRLLQRLALAVVQQRVAPHLRAPELCAVSRVDRAHRALLRAHPELWRGVCEAHFCAPDPFAGRWVAPDIARARLLAAAHDLHRWTASQAGAAAAVAAAAAAEAEDAKGKGRSAVSKFVAAAAAPVAAAPAAVPADPLSAVSWAVLAHYLFAFHRKLPWTYTRPTADPDSGDAKAEAAAAGRDVWEQYTPLPVDPNASAATPVPVHHNVTIAFVGDSYGGSTALWRCCADGGFDPSHTRTIGRGVCSVWHVMPDSAGSTRGSGDGGGGIGVAAVDAAADLQRRVCVGLIDTPGLETYRAIACAYTTAAQVVVLCADAYNPCPPQRRYEDADAIAAHIPQAMASSRAAAELLRGSARDAELRRIDTATQWLHRYAEWLKAVRAHRPARAPFAANDYRVIVAATKCDAENATDPLDAPARGTIGAAGRRVEELPQRARPHVLAERIVRFEELSAWCALNGVELIETSARRRVGVMKLLRRAVWTALALPCARARLTHAHDYVAQQKSAAQSSSSCALM